MSDQDNQDNQGLGAPTAEYDTLIGDKDRLIPDICARMALAGTDYIANGRKVQDITKLTNLAVELLSTVAMVNADKHPMAMTREQLLVDNALAARESYLMEISMGNIANLLLDPRAQSLPAGKLRGMVLQLVAEGLECRAAHSQNAKAAMAKLERGDVRRADGEVSKHLTLVTSK